MPSVIKDITDIIRTADNDRLEERLRDNPSLADNKIDPGISILQYAIYCRNTAAVELIKKYKKLDPDIFEAACLGDVETVDKELTRNPEMLNYFSPDGFTLLGFASFFGHLHLVKILLEKGADPNIQSNNNLNVAPIHSACSGSNYEIAELLIHRGANVNARQLQGYTPLHTAAHNGNTELAKLLLKNGADQNATTDDGKTPYSIAIEKGFKSIVDLMIPKSTQ